MENAKKRGEQYKHVDPMQSIMDKKYLKGITKKEILDQLEYEIKEGFEESLVVDEGYSPDVLKPTDFAKLATTFLAEYEEDARTFNVHPAVCVAHANGLNANDNYEDYNYDKFMFNLMETIRLRIAANEI
ncbi:hypothetical protein CN918_25915 [Priestia megaterium]|nr:hypothetical protein CN918_25915 [Priestia megaterium]